MDENRKREGLGLGVRKQLIRPCTGDVRTVGEPSDQPFALGASNQSGAKIRRTPSVLIPRFCYFTMHNTKCVTLYPILLSTGRSSSVTCKSDLPFPYRYYNSGTHKINPPTFWAWYKYCPPSHIAISPSLSSIHPHLRLCHPRSSITSIFKLQSIRIRIPIFAFRVSQLKSQKMPPKAAEKKPSTGGKAPAGKAPADKKEAGKKTAAAPSGEKKKRGKTRKETYSSYIYKGMPLTAIVSASHRAQSS